MEELEVGEYIRTKDGIIAKITDIVKEYCIDCDEDVFDLYNGPMMEIPWEHIKEYVIKHSKIISEVVEVGDYVNGKLIHKIDKGQNYCYLYYGNCKTFVSYQIKTILTKEQYMQNCYKVEEE